MKKIRIWTHDEWVISKFRELRRALWQLNHCDGRCKSPNRKWVNMVIDEINEAGMNYLGIGSLEDILKLKIISKPNNPHKIFLRVN